MFPKTFTFGALLCALSSPLWAQVPTTAVQGQYLDDYAFAGPPTTPLVDENGIPLDAGTVAAGDGDVLQFGYFSGVAATADVSTFGDAEWNTFTPITSTGGRYFTTIGDSGGISGNLGIFTISLTLDPALDPELPTAYPVRMGIRFFNDTSLAAATHYNVVTSNEDSWRLFGASIPAPTPPNYMNLDDPAATLYWRSGPGGEFQTALSLMPEPSTFTLALLGAASLCFARRRRSH